MNKKISELISELDIERIQDIELQDLPEQGEESISLEAIKEKAMEGIKVTRLEDSKAAKNINKKKFKWNLVPLVAVLIAMGITVVAIESTGILRNIFGESFHLIEQDVQQVETQFIKDGVIFTVEEAIIDSKSGVIVVSMEREDGLPFEENTEIRELSIHTEHGGGLGWGSEYSFSTDKTKLIGEIDLSGGRQLYGQEITITAMGLGHWEPDYTTFTTDKEGPWNISFELGQNKNIKKKNTHTKVKKEDLQVTIRQVELSPLGVTIQGYYRNGLKMSLDGYLQMKDGSTLKLYSASRSGKFKLLFVEQFKLEGEAVLINTEEVESIVIEGVTIPMN